MGLWLELGLLIIIIAVAGSAAWAAWRAAPYVPTPAHDVQRILDLAAVKPNETVVDLGAGDGRLVLAAAKRGATAIGYEIAILPYLVAVIRCALSSHRLRAHINFQDFYQADLRSAQVVIAFLLPRAMAKLKPKFEAELQSGTRVVSYAFPIPGWTPLRKDKTNARQLATWVYKVT